MYITFYKLQKEKLIMYIEMFKIEVVNIKLNSFLFIL